MTITLDLTPAAEASLRRQASREGADEQSLALRLLIERLTEEDVEAESMPGGRSMADLFAGHVGLVAGSGEAFSENGGARFAEGLKRKHSR